MKQGKIWGNTELIESNNSLEFHRIEFKKNVCCSEHYHQTKNNGFFIESGIMLVKVWPNKRDPVTKEDILKMKAGIRYDKTVLHAGDYMKVPAGVWHQFVGVEDGVAFELYWSDFDKEDIVRRVEGHRIETPATESHQLDDLNYEED